MLVEIERPVKPGLLGQQLLQAALTLEVAGNTAYSELEGIPLAPSRKPGPTGIGFWSFRDLAQDQYSKHPPGPVGCVAIPPSALAVATRIDFHIHINLLQTPGEIVDWFTGDNPESVHYAAWSQLKIRVVLGSHADSAPGSGKTAIDDAKTAVADLKRSLGAAGTIVVYLGHSGMGPASEKQKLMEERQDEAYKAQKKMADQYDWFPKPYPVVKPEGHATGLLPLGFPYLTSRQLCDMIKAAKCSLVIIGTCDSMTELKGLSGGPPVVGFFSGKNNVTPGSWMLHAACAFLFSLIGLSYEKERWFELEPREVRQCGLATLGEALNAANEMLHARKVEGILSNFQDRHFNWPSGDMDDFAVLLQGDPNKLLLP